MVPGVEKSASAMTKREVELCSTDSRGRLSLDELVCKNLQPLHLSPDAASGGRFGVGDFSGGILI